MDLVPKYLFDDLFDTFFNQPMLKNNFMKVDIYTENGLYKIELEVPGFNKEDINITLDKGYLTIIAKKEDVKEDKKYIKKERFYGEYQRSFYIGDIEEEAIKAEFENGVIKLSLPKENDKNTTKKNIEIQ